jgi:hypothetical protein
MLDGAVVYSAFTASALIRTDEKTDVPVAS